MSFCSEFWGLILPGECPGGELRIDGEVGSSCKLKQMRFRLLPAFGMLVVVAGLDTLCSQIAFAAVQQRNPATPIFSSDRAHIWNRLHDCLFVRESASGARFGADTVDPLLWDETRYLLTGDSHTRALSCLDEF